MNWNEIVTQIVLGILGVLITALGVVVTYLVNRYIKNDELKEIIKSLNELIKNAVLEIQQVYVDEMKCKNIFDKEAQKLAVERCLNIVKTNMPKKVEEWLKANYTDIEGYLRTLIEAQVKLLKIGG